jgi:transcriptional regulator with XRE-family HTH domain
MARLKRNTSDYTPFGLLLDRLCREKGISFRQLAIQSGMSATSHATIIRACQGKSTPKRDSILKWCEVLQASSDERASLLGAFHYTAE